MKLIPTPKPLAHGDRGISQGAEFAGGIVVFFLLGFGLDAWLDTTPLFMVALVVFATVGQFVKMYFVYTQDMKRLEDERASAARADRRG